MEEEAWVVVRIEESGTVNVRVIGARLTVVTPLWQKEFTVGRFWVCAAGPKRIFISDVRVVCQGN